MNSAHTAGPANGHAGEERNHPMTGDRSPAGARRPGHGAVAAVVAVVATLLAAACSTIPLPAPPARAGGTANGTAPPPCTVMAVRSCALPFPSDEFVVADPTSATGVRVRMPDGLVDPAALGQLGPGATLADAFGAADGFSALSPVIFEVDRPVDQAALPADGGDVLKVFDLADGHQVPVRVELPLEAAQRGAPGTVVMAWPRLRWEYGHTYVARLTRVRGGIGDPSPAPAMGDAGIHPGTDYASALRKGLQQVDPGAVPALLSATRFTVGSRDNAIGDLVRMADSTRRADHPVRNLRVQSPLLVQHAAAVVRGELRISDFRDADGVARADNGAKETWIPFLLVLPEHPASPRGAPVAVYGHGLTINKESMLLVAAPNAAKGVATIGIDVPNHGERQFTDGGYLFDLTTPGRLGRLVNMPVQGIVDHVALVSAIVHHLGTVDLSPWRPEGPDGDGVADLDTSTILYEGTSMGSVLGAAEVALNPEIDAAYLQVGGTGVADIIMHSLLWVLFSGVVPWNASAGDGAALMGAASMLMDRSDNVHLLDGLRQSGPPVFLQVGVGDNVVPNFSSERLVHLLDLPRVGRRLTDISARSAGDSIPADGRGFAEVWPVNSAPDNQGFVAHVSFTEPRAAKWFDQWLDQRLAAAGITGSG